MPHLHMIEFGGFLVNTGSEINDLPKEPQVDDGDDREYHRAKELGHDADGNLDYFNCCVPSHLYLYLQGATTIKEAMENIKRACALDGVSVQATPVETRITCTVPFMQMADRQDSKAVPNSKDILEKTALEIKGVMDSLDKSIDRLARTVEKQSRRLSRDSRENNRRSYRSDSDSSSEDDSHHRYRSRSIDNFRSRSRSRGRSRKTCTYCHKPNHDLSHCYKLVKELKKLYSGEMKIDRNRDRDEQARLQMLSCIKIYLESEKDSTN